MDCITHDVQIARYVDPIVCNTLYTHEYSDYSIIDRVNHMIVSHGLYDSDI